MVDILVVGAGVFGLSVALAAHRAGLSVRVLDRAGPGAGASGGIVGALTPHAPTKWRFMMRFQFDALLSLPRWIAELERSTGIGTGYGRVGRLMPLADEAAAERAERDMAAAAEVWAGRATMARRRAPDWLAPDIGRYGVIEDDLSARIMPHRYIAALAAALPDGTIANVEVLSADGNRVETGTGALAAAHVVLSAGAAGWTLLPAALQGSGVKGQAALFDLDMTGQPVVTHGGLYIIPHGDGTVAVGSTSEKTWETDAPDARLDDVLARAALVLPALAGRQPVRRWAGIRPKPPGREPLVGPVPGQPGLWVASGGFRIGLGIAHAVADGLIAEIRGEAPSPHLPDSFRPVA